MIRATFMACSIVASLGSASLTGFTILAMALLQKLDLESPVDLLEPLLFVQKQVHRELALIEKLHLAGYFLYDQVVEP